MNRQSSKSPRQRAADAPAPHPVLDRSAKLRERIRALGLDCMEQVWRGWYVKHRFMCKQGHEIEVSPGNLLGGGGACPVCRDEASIRRLHALASAVDAICLDDTWRGFDAAYRFQCMQGHEWSHTATKTPGCPVCIKNAANAGKRLKDGLQRLVQAAKEREGTCLSEVYLGQAVQHRFRCAKGHEWQTAANDVLRGTWCGLCANERKVTQYRLADGLARLQQAAAAKGGISLSDVYEGSIQRYRFRCGQGHEWQAIGKGILRGGWCMDCGNSKRSRLLLLSDGLLRLQQAAAAKGGVCLSEAYLGHQRRHRFRCGQGHEWNTVAASIFQGGWCSVCIRAARRLGIEVARAAARARGGECLSTTYVGVGVKMSWMCHKGHVWQTRFSQIRKGQWCPDCAHMAQITSIKSKARARYRAAGHGS